MVYLTPEARHPLLVALALRCADDEARASCSLVQLSRVGPLQLAQQLRQI
jgi:hypothetical protein